MKHVTHNMKHFFSTFSLVFTLLALNSSVLAQVVSTPEIRSFYASSQSRFYAGDANNNNQPDFAVGKSMEFEFMACDNLSAVTATLDFGDGSKQTFQPLGCAKVSVPHTYAKASNNVLAVLDVKNDAGRSVVQALKLDIVPLNPNQDPSRQLAEADTGIIIHPAVPIAQNPSPTPSQEVARAPEPAVNPLPLSPSTPTSAIAQAKPNQDLAQAGTVTESFASSPLLGAFVTGVLALLFIVILIYAIRTLFNRS